MKTDTKRGTFNLSAPAGSALDRLVEANVAESQTAVINRALLVLEALHEIKTEGGVLLVQENDGSTGRLRLL